MISGWPPPSPERPRNCLERALLIRVRLSCLSNIKRGIKMDADTGSGMGIVGLLISLAFIVLMVVSAWKVYTKAGQPGWAVLIPIYNIIVLFKIAGKPWWWIFGFLVPILNFVVIILVLVALARVFGKGGGFAIGLLFLPFIFYPILAFGDAKYKRPPAPA
jgi:Family of unknown function (DUF5684)